MPHKNPEIAKEYFAKYHQKNKDKKRLTCRRSRAVYSKRNREFTDSYLSIHPCIDCGESDINVLEFDHIRNDKFRRGVSGLIQDGASIQLLLKEIEKCEVRCCNCHRKITLKRLG